MFCVLRFLSIVSSAFFLTASLSYAQFASTPEPQDASAQAAPAEGPVNIAPSKHDKYIPMFNMLSEIDVGGQGFNEDANLINPAEQLMQPQQPSRVSYNGSMTFSTFSRSDASSFMNSDTLVFSGGAGYNFSEKVDFSIRGTFIDARQRSVRYENVQQCVDLEEVDLQINEVPRESSCQTQSGETGFLQIVPGPPIREVSRDTRFTDSWFGINYNIKGETKSPGMYASADVSILERSKFQDNNGSEKTKNHYAGSWSLGFGMFRSIDPVVLSLNFGYSFNLERREADRSILPGRSFSISPSVNFSINNQVSINWGVSISRSGKSKVDGEAQGIVESSMQSQMGVSMVLSEKTSLSFSRSNNLSGEPSASFTLGFGYRP